MTLGCRKENHGLPPAIFQSRKGPSKVWFTAHRQRSRARCRVESRDGRQPIKIYKRTCRFKTRPRRFGSTREGSESALLRNRISMTISCMLSAGVFARPRTVSFLTEYISSTCSRPG
ncbi:hypothetical protein BDW59DRAFT_152843 [Aspergillus cavernicola]|uniref:Uncharacterized protein n=1 Tax=Aspergillus cavernicola TaxID=176166 RepID=A0ABR4HP37_9EURO